MRYLLNLPLFIAFLSTARAFIVAAASVHRGGDAGLGAAYEIAFETVIGWLMLAIVLGACGAMGGLPYTDGIYPDELEPIVAFGAVGVGVGTCVIIGLIIARRIRSGRMRRGWRSRRRARHGCWRRGG